MDRELDAVYVLARNVVESILDAAGYHLASEAHHPDAFGSADAEYRGRHERIRLIWDGKDRWLGLQTARPVASNQFPGPASWESLEPRAGAAPALFLRPGAGADARVAELAEVLSQHLQQAV